MIDTSIFSWGSNSSSNDIQPGFSKSGYYLASFGLPYISTGHAWYYTPPDTGERDEPVSIFASAIVERTIAPRALTTPFDCLAFLDTVKSYIHESRTLGWITSDTTANKYKRLIDSAKANLAASPTRRGVAKAKLDSVLANVYPDTASSVLTSEAYALIRFNTEYVMRKLREEDASWAVENRSSTWDATASNGARHLVKSGNLLHEVFVSGGEVFYRRSDDGGSSWGQMHQLNEAYGENSHPCITATRSGYLQVVWQRKVAPAIYEVWHSYSENGGDSWSIAAILPDAGEVSVSSYQPQGTMPVIADGPTLVVVYCSDEGLRYRVSDDEGATWHVPGEDVIDGLYNSRVRYLSMAGGDSYLSLLYDYANDSEGPYSRVFEGSSWSDEEKVAKGAIGSDGGFSSVAIDADDKPVAVWSGVVNSWSRNVIFRAGEKDNTWSKWFVAFGDGPFGADWLNPSVTYQNREDKYSVAIVNYTSSSHVKYTQYVDNGPLVPPSWETVTLSETGVEAMITQESSSSGSPVVGWTDQGSFPYEVVVTSTEENEAPGGRPGTISPGNVGWSRRAVLYHQGLGASLTLEMERLRIVYTQGDTIALQYKSSPPRGRDSISLASMWEYLGSGTIDLPANAKRLILKKQFLTRGSVFAKGKFALRVLNAAGGVIGVADTTANSGTVSINIEQFAGMKVTLRPHLTLVGIDPNTIALAVGDVFTFPPGNDARPGRSDEHQRRR